MTAKHNRPAGRSGGAAGKGTFQYGQQSQYSTTVRAVPVHRADGRIVGELRGDVASTALTLTKHAKREHMLQRPAAWAWDDAILQAAENAGARFTEIECDGLIYRASIADFKRYGFPVNRGFGPQRGLALTYWHVRRVGEAPAAVQLGLFEAAR